jgi:predicted transcriptional regulator
MKEVITIEELRASIFERLSKIASKDILVQIHTLLQSEEGGRDWWDDLTAAQKTSIEAGLADLKAGRRKSHAEVMKKYGM